MELRYYQYFIAFNEELHFGRAAERVRIAQPALSIQIKALEKKLGGLLFERTNRNVALTGAGKVFLQEARRVVEQEERAMAVARRAASGTLGELTIGYSGNAAYSGIMGKNVQSFRRSHPDVELKITEMNPMTQLDALEKRQINVGFLTTLSISLPRSIQTKKLAEWPLLLAVPRTHALAGKKAVNTKMFKDEPFIVYAGITDHGSTPMIVHAAGFEPQVAYQAANVMLMLTLVGAGMGVSLVAAPLADITMHSQISYIPVEDIRMRMDCSLAFRKFEKEAVVKRFLDVCRETKAAEKNTSAIA